jgi:SagB-type dehydrogenase family enzyme
LPLLLRRNPDLVTGWTSNELRIRNSSTGAEAAAAGIAGILAEFDSPRSAAIWTREFPAHRRSALRRTIRALCGAGFLVPVSRAAKRPSRSDAWMGNMASAQYHGACRDLKYLRKPSEIQMHFTTVVLSRPRPSAFKRYRSAPEQTLPRLAPDGDAAALDRVLQARRTVRQFRRAAVRFEVMARVLRSTFGVTGILRTELGHLATRTSPSAGALHPIEAYVLAWNVAGLSAGLYHYDVFGDGLRRLRRGDLRRVAVELASGQTWVARAAFLCVLTAVFPRVLWKYPAEDSYRTLFLDAGHLAQTFCLVATSLGLGPFTTAAIQDTKIEKLLRIDGIEEFPVYLCGAGLPARVSRRAGKKSPATRL